MTVAVDLFHFGHVFLKLNLRICKLLYPCFTSSVLERLCPCPAPCGIYKKNSDHIVLWMEICVYLQKTQEEN